MLVNRQWIRSTVKSFIAMFGPMRFQMGTKFYMLYLTIFTVGILGYIANFYKFKHIKDMKENKNKGLLEIIFGINIIIPIILSIYYSYCSDFQPQGRYIMPIVMPFMYFVVSGLENIIEKFIKNEKIKKIVQYTIIFVGILLPLLCLRKMMIIY